MSQAYFCFGLISGLSHYLVPYTKCSASGFMENKSNKFYQGAQMTKTVSTPSLTTKLDHCFWNATDVKTLVSFLENNNTAPLSFRE